MSVVSTRRTITQYRIFFTARVERERNRVRGEHQLFFETQKIHRRRAVWTVERTQSLNFLGIFDQSIAHGQLSRHMFFRVSSALTHDQSHFIVGHNRR